MIILSGHRMERANEDIKRELTAILRELKDPRIKESLLSIVRVDTTNDLSYSTVYISSISDICKTKEAVKILNKSAAPFVRKEISLRLKLRHSPKIIFEATDSIEYSSNISKILSNLRGDKNE